MSEKRYKTVSAMLDGLTTEQAVWRLADAYLDAREWRREEAELLERYRHRLESVEETLLQLVESLGGME